MEISLNNLQVDSKRLYEKIDNSIDIDIIKTKAKMSDLDPICQLMSYSTQTFHSQLCSPGPILCLSFNMPLLLFPPPPLLIMHTYLAGRFLLQQLFLIYKQITPIAGISPLWIFFLMILREAKWNGWFRKAIKQNYREYLKQHRMLRIILLSELESWHLLLICGIHYNGFVQEWFYKEPQFRCNSPPLCRCFVI